MISIDFNGGFLLVVSDGRIVGLGRRNVSFSSYLRNRYFSNIEMRNGLELFNEIMLGLPLLPLAALKITSLLFGPGFGENYRMQKTMDKRLNAHVVRIKSVETVSIDV